MLTSFKCEHKPHIINILKNLILICFYFKTKVMGSGLISIAKSFKGRLEIFFMYLVLLEI